ncbi:MAG: class B sortase [Oscillospiraceae bacterium]|nr:class B sortase [Oscillospiraceae bacterium]
MRDDDFHFDPDDDEFWKDDMLWSSLDDTGGLEDIDWSRETEDYQPRRSQREQSGRQTSRSQGSQANRQTSRSRSAASGSRQRQANQQARTRSYDQQSRTRSQSGRAGRSYDYETQARARSYDNRRRRQKKNIPLIIVAVVLALGMVIAGWRLISILLNYQRDRSAYNDLASNAISALAETDDDADTDTTDTDTDDTDSDSYVPIIVDWEYLESINTDIVGWIYCPDTVINYPVVQTSDNEYYLKRGFNQQSNTSGTLFADVSSVIGINMCNFIVYGHNMKDGSMFGSIEGYVDQSYYEEHPVMYYLTPTETYRIDLIAAHIVESTLDNYPGYFDSTADYQTYLNQLTSASLFTTSATVSTDYQLITLSTCDYSSSYNDPRFLLHGLLVPIG